MPAPVPPGATLSYTGGESLGPCRVGDLRPSPPPCRDALPAFVPLCPGSSFQNPACVQVGILSSSHPLFGFSAFSFFFSSGLRGYMPTSGPLGASA